MARRCKCVICKKDLTTDKAYKVIINGKSKYYCCEEEYKNEEKQKNDRQHCLEFVAKSMRLKFATPSVQKEVNKLKEYYDYAVIERCFKENESSINWFLNNNEDSSDYGKCRYILTIIQNNINKTYKKYIKELEQMKSMFKNEPVVELEIMNITENMISAAVGTTSASRTPLET
jgi:hypothetical protein